MTVNATKPYDLVSRNSSQFLQLLHRYFYPNIQRPAVRAFMTAVVGFLEQQAARDRNPLAALLKDRFRDAANFDELVFLHDNDEGELIPDFSGHFLRGVYVFKNATHVFDRETFVQKALSKTEIREGARRLDYRFADSRSEVGVQLADVVAHLFGKYFTFLQDNSLAVLLERKGAFTDMQRDNLALLRELIDRSDAISNAFCHTIMPLDTDHKNNAFLHDVQAPRFIV